MISRLAFFRFAIVLVCCIGFLLLNQNVKQPQYVRNVKYTEPIQIREIFNNYTPYVTIRDIIKQQDDLTKHNFVNFPFKKRAKLKDYQLSYGGTPLRSIILTTWRSGSTFLGDVLNALPGNYYHYEPLLHFGIVRVRGPPLARSALNTLRKLLACDYKDLGDYLHYGRSHYNLFTHNHRLWNQCEQYPRFCFNSTFLSEFCKLFPFQSMKVVRLSLKLGKNLLKYDPNVKILLLVRDPRGTLQSRKHRDWCPGIDDCDKPEVLCDDLVEDYHLALKLQALFPDRFRAIRYEDLSLNPYDYVRNIFKFFGLYLHPDVLQFLDTHTKANVGGVSSTFRDSKSAPFHWRYDLNFSEVEEIQMICSEAMKLWGYTKAINETHLREFNPLGWVEF
ncbi:carbohydrate sulfotransferase 5-like [Onthophagus taurus]|uniref:carbohydrate sulfotransferase 5-like n=1 Tax=Onthophagus taurus TaxID=166361 RepID=UPI000C20935F|nr:carbohydrate sulfotransferase 5-like [Onthophagus taurus]